MDSPALSLTRLSSMETPWLKTAIPSRDESNPLSRLHFSLAEDLLQAMCASL
jgi:hypothetical protein